MRKCTPGTGVCANRFPNPDAFAACIRRCARVAGICDCCAGPGGRVAEPTDKPGSVVDSHSSRRTVTGTLEQPTRTRRGQRHEVPIWSCSRWGLPCRSVTGLAVRSYRTISPLPAFRRRRRRYLSVALSVGSRRPGVTWHLALWSPDFPRHRRMRAPGMTRLSGRLRRAHCRTPRSARAGGYRPSMRASSSSRPSWNSGDSVALLWLRPATTSNRGSTCGGVASNSACENAGAVTTSSAPTT